MWLFLQNDLRAMKKGGWVECLPHKQDLAWLSSNPHIKARFSNINS